MAFEPLDLTVNGKPVRLFRGATVRHALNLAAEGGRLVRLVEQGRAVVWDEGADAQTDLGGAVYPGQRLSIKPTSGN